MPTSLNTSVGGINLTINKNTADKNLKITDALKQLDDEIKQDNNTSSAQIVKPLPVIQVKSSPAKG